jgi:hypothetical protein
MGKKSDIDKAIANLMRWAERPEWSDERAAVLNDHMAQVSRRLNTSLEELGAELADYGGMLIGMFIEDLASRRFTPGNRNIVDDYLKRRGWRESVAGGSYLQQLRDSVLSLYEVVDVFPGKHCDLSDLVRGGKTVRVAERTATQQLVKWDRIAARVLKAEGKRTFSGGMLPFAMEPSQQLLKMLNNAGKKADKRFSQLLTELADEEVAESQSSESLQLQLLRSAVPMFVQVWMLDTLDRLHAPPPEIVNRDGDVLVFTETRFRVSPSHQQDVAQRLDNSASWCRDNENELAWIWLPDNEVSPNDNEAGAQPILGSLELKSDSLVLTTNSVERAERGKQTLAMLLEGLVGPPLTRLQTPEQMMADAAPTAIDMDERNPLDASIDPAEAERITHETLDTHYRQILDEPIPALGNKTPRQCVKSKSGKKKVTDWLKHLENQEMRRATSQGVKPYDSGWMWEALKLDSESR